MASIADFVKIPKIDSCKHLSSGLRYPSFVQWAGFFIPDFDENAARNSGSDEDLLLRREIGAYTQTRIGSARDIYLLLCHSISESVSENVAVLNGTVNVDFLSKCRNATEFLDVVRQAAEKFSDKIKVRFFLGIDSDNENNLPLAEMLLESNLFAGIELYGNRFAESQESFLSIFNTARKMGIESRICCLGFRDCASRDEIFEILLNLRPTHLMNPNIAVSNDGLQIFKSGKIYPEVVEFIKNTGIKLEFSPAPILSGKEGGAKARIIREFVRQSVPCSLCSEDVLYLNKSVSEFAADLCNMGAFDVDEIIPLFATQK